MNKELNLYNINIKKPLTGGGKKDKTETYGDLDILRKYRKKCLELKKENTELKKEIQKLKKDL